MYKAIIYYEAELDNYENGVSGNIINEWQEKLTAKTTLELREKVLSATYSIWEDLNDEQINEYKNATEYITSYMADSDNQGEASKHQLEQFKAGSLDLYVIYCHILVSEVIEKKATL